MNNNNKNVRVIGNPAVINHQRPVNLVRMPRPQISREQIKQIMDRLKKKK